MVDGEVTNIISGFDVSDWNWDLIESFDMNNPMLFAGDLSAVALPTLGGTPKLLSWQINDEVQNEARPWFLKKETWMLQHHPKEPDCSRMNYDPYILEITEMLRSWSKSGYNVFIHPKLYENGMPPCIQDAFTTLSAYFYCNSNMKSTVLQIVEEHSRRLEERETQSFGEYQDVRDHLARVHALFVYMFIRLFDGSVRLRASAERQILLLRSWLSDMLYSASQSVGLNTTVHQSLIQQNPSNIEVEFEAISEQWKAWCVAETVRRTHFIVTTVLNIYDSMLTGLKDCPGAVMFTLRRGLWQAQSASRWMEIVSVKSPLLVSALDPGPLIASYPAQEFDELAQILWKYLVSQEKTQYWMDKSEAIAISET